MRLTLNHSFFAASSKEIWFLLQRSSLFPASSVHACVCMYMHAYVCIQEVRYLVRCAYVFLASCTYACICMYVCKKFGFCYSV